MAGRPKVLQVGVHGDLISALVEAGLAAAAALGGGGHDDIDLEACPSGRTTRSS